MEVYRLSKLKYSKSLISSGASNRWNRAGQAVIYAASSRALSTLELVVHRSSIIQTDTYEMMVIQIKDHAALIKEIKLSDLPGNWNTLDAYPITQQMGSKWYEKQETLLLKVPSVIIHSEFNYVINLEHPLFKPNVKLIKNEEFFWDERLV